MNKIKIILVFLIILIGGCSKEKVEDINKEEIKMNMTINNQKVNLVLENNDTVKELGKHLPINTQMHELNNNEKYVYLDFNLPTNSITPEKIEVGDVYLYEDNCLVIFYQDFFTNYSYTKIGHITDLPKLDESDISLLIE